MLTDELEIAVQLALEAGEALRRARRDGLEVRFKGGPDDPVTQADLEADRLIRAGLARAFPQDGLLSEETADSSDRLQKARVWIIDPIDSTSDYAKGGDEHAVSIGFAQGGHAALGVVYNPARAELFAGIVSQGVTLNGQPVRATETSSLKDARISVSHTEWKRGLSEYAARLPIHPRSSIAYKLARVAAGLEDACFTAAPRSEWDVCAGVALCLAAGLRATLRDGGEVAFNRPDPRLPVGVVAANPSLYPELLEMLKSIPAITWTNRKP